MKSDMQELNSLITGMHLAFERGENAMAWARENVTNGMNTHVSTLIAYDLQSGSYVSYAQKNPKWIKQWTGQLANLIQPYIESGDTVLEVGVGEATTLAGVIKLIGYPDVLALGFDISFSRIAVARKWLEHNSIEARLFVGDLFHIPLEDNSVDVVYTSHSLEPNGGREEQALTELLRVARKAVVLVEPCYELANENAQQRMLEHGYVSGLKATAEKLAANVMEYGLLDVCSNKLNPSGVLSITKSNPSQRNNGAIRWQCPLTGAPMNEQKDIYFATQVGIAYPVMRGIPLLRAEHAVLASKILG